MKDEDALIKRIVDAHNADDLIQVRKLQVRRVEIRRRIAREMELLARVERSLGQALNRISDRRMSQVGVPEFIPTGDLSQETGGEVGRRNADGGKTSGKRTPTKTEDGLIHEPIDDGQHTDGVFDDAPFDPDQADGFDYL